jgi:hypothetical protein
LKRQLETEARSRLLQPSDIAREAFVLFLNSRKKARTQTVAATESADRAE